jgi:hypothetical protein
MNPAISFGRRTTAMRAFTFVTPGSGDHPLLTRKSGAIYCSKHPPGKAGGLPYLFKIDSPISLISSGDLSPRDELQSSLRVLFWLSPWFYVSNSGKSGTENISVYLHNVTISPNLYAVSQRPSQRVNSTTFYNTHRVTFSASSYHHQTQPYKYGPLFSPIPNPHHR